MAVKSKIQRFSVFFFHRKLITIENSNLVAVDYTNSFSYNIKLYGVPNFEPEQFHRFMNIVAVESKLSGMIQMRDKFLRNTDTKEVSLELSELYEKLHALTNRMHPDKLWVVLGGRKE